MINNRLSAMETIRLLFSAGVKALGVHLVWQNINWLIIARRKIEVGQKVSMTLS